MKKRKQAWKTIGLSLLLAACFGSGPVFARDYYGFRIYLNDKGREEISLSPEAMDRRERLRIPLDDSDRPIAPERLDELREAGFRPLVASRWFSTVVVATEDSAAVERLRAWPFADSVRWVWKGAIEPERKGERPERDDSRLTPSDEPTKDFYGYGQKQIEMLKGDRLHQEGFRGEGIRVAVIDDGFRNVDRIAAFDSLRLRGTRDFVFPERSVFEGDDHGTRVLSCLAAYLPGVMVGTAPKADYWLFKSEDNRGEFPIEEDYWVAAAEMADSVGVDLITTSLGYSDFDREEMNYPTDRLDGRSTLISRAAAMAARKGILVFCSAGNEGMSAWGHLCFPADADSILTIGAVTEKKRKSDFSSTGPTADGRVKPDLVALGTGCAVIDPTGRLRFANGTSFATPILAGLGACLLQALPALTPEELRTLFRQAGHRAKRPTAELGYGLPNVYKLYKKAKHHAKN